MLLGLAINLRSRRPGLCALLAAPVALCVSAALVLGGPLGRWLPLLAQGLALAAALPVLVRVLSLWRRRGLIRVVMRPQAET